MEIVQERVWMEAAKTAYQMADPTMDAAACLSMEEGVDLSIEVQALGIY